MGSEGFKTVVRIQKPWTRLAKCPENTKQGRKEGGDSHRFVQAEQHGLARELIAIRKRRVFGQQSKRKRRQDKKCR
jgi:hypothetical protein